MMELKELLAELRYEREVRGSANCLIKSLQFDSRKIESGSLFIAVRGLTTDGHNYISNALENGAVAVVCEKLPDDYQEIESRSPNGICWVKIANTQVALADLAAIYYRHPSRDLKLVGVTGTNGKTTIVTLLYELFRSLNEKVGLISTIRYKVNEQTFPSTHTTPNPLRAQQLLRQMVDEGCRYAFMEVSSHAMVQDRVRNIHFSGGVFTNLTHDHLDYHGDFDSYLKAKKSFFDLLPKSAFALSNIDDKRGAVMLQNTQASKKTYAQSKPADYRVRVLENDFGGMLLDLDGEQVFCRLIGSFNADNLLAIYATARLLGREKMEVLTAMTTLSSAEGRFDFIRQEEQNITGIVDYAHTSDALEKLLDTVRKIRNKGQRIITVIGCGGDRDKTKRPKMARVACHFSDQVILTSDNPRTENPFDILVDMKTGVEKSEESKVLEIENRREAIRTAVRLARKGDIIVVAGKGHEPYQEINGVRHPFNDKEVLASAFGLEEA